MAQFSPLIPADQSTWDALKYGVIWAIWSYSGYDGLAAASEEIVEPERTYPKVLAVFLPISVAAYVLPLWAGLAASPDWAAWGPAHLSIAAGVLGGTLLATLIASAGQVGALGLYNGEQLILARFLYAMSRDGMLPPILARLHKRHQTPHVSLIFHAVLFSVLSFVFDFVELLVLGAIVSVPVYIITFVSPLILRWKVPQPARALPHPRRMAGDHSGSARTLRARPLPDREFHPGGARRRHRFHRGGAAHLLGGALVQPAARNHHRGAEPGRGDGSAGAGQGQARAW